MQRGYLPFPRGTTWKDGNTASTAGAPNGVPGKSYFSDDKSGASGFRHDENSDLELVGARNRTAATIKRGASGREDSRLWKIRASSAGGFGNISTVAAFGELGYPIDDSMATSKGWAVGDDGLLIRKGLARVTLITATSGGSPGSGLIARTGGYVGPHTVAGTIKGVVGVAMETYTATAGKRTILALMGAEWAAVEHS